MLQGLAGAVGCIQHSSGYFSLAIAGEACESKKRTPHGRVQLDCEL